MAKKISNREKRRRWLQSTKERILQSSNKSPGDYALIEEINHELNNYHKVPQLKVKHNVEKPQYEYDDL